jgi:hypothetical protein
MVSRDGLGRVAVGRTLSGHRLGESVPKALKEERRVETAVRTVLSIFLGRRKGHVVHGERRILSERVITRTVRFP